MLPTFMVLMAGVLNNGLCSTSDSGNRRIYV